MDTSTPSETNTPLTKRAALLEIVARTRDLERILADFFDANARATTGTVEVWAPKDHFVLSNVAW